MPRPWTPTNSASERYLANIQGEIDSAALYRALSEAEEKPEIAEVYRRLAAVEQAHAEFWKNRLSKLGEKFPDLHAGWRTRALIWLARRFGPAFVLPVVSSLERSDVGQYDTQSDAVAGGLPAAERSHARIIQAVASSVPSMSIGTLARLEGRHRMGGGNALRAAVLGANDGLVSNLSLVMGVAGASLTEHAILVTGVAGLLAGACSMAMGEWLSVNTSRESYQRQIEIEAQELGEAPEEEKEELVLIYRAKGLKEDEARALAGRLMSTKGSALNTLVKEELGIDPEELGGSAWTAAASSFLLFAIGAIFPIMPFLLMPAAHAIPAGPLLSAAAFFCIGAGTTLFTGRSIALSGMRQLSIGMAAAGVTYALGRLIGMSIAG